MRSSSSSILSRIVPFFLLVVCFQTVTANDATNFGGSCSGCDQAGYFCGIDNQCHVFSCQNYYQYADRTLTGYSDNSTFQCFGYAKGDQENAHGVVFGCEPLFPFVLTTPGKQVTEPFNRKCTAEREGGYSFECYEFQPSETATDFTFFVNEAESSFPDCEDGVTPKYWYLIASSNHYQGVEGLQGNPIVAGGADDDGDTIWQTNDNFIFNRELAMTSIYANVVGGPSPPSNTAPIQAGAIGGNNPLKGEKNNNGSDDTSGANAMLNSGMMTMMLGIILGVGMFLDLVDGEPTVAPVPVPTVASPGVPGATPFAAPSLAAGTNPDVTAIPDSQVGPEKPSDQVFDQEFGDLFTPAPSAAPSDAPGLPSSSAGNSQQNNHPPSLQTAAVGVAGIAMAAL